MKQTNFESWETQDLELTFGLEQDWENEKLKEWLGAESTFNEIEKVAIEKLRLKMLQFVDFWNEDELKMQGISRILDIVDYTSEKYTVFSQRPLKAVIDEIELHGRVDFMLATGRQKPIKPYLYIFITKQFPHFIPHWGKIRGLEIVIQKDNYLQNYWQPKFTTK